VTNVYDAGGRVTSQTDELNRTTLIDYTSISNATKITDPKGNVTVEGYKNYARTSITRAYNTPVAATWTMDYDASLGLTKVRDPNGRFRTAVYDGHGNTTGADRRPRPQHPGHLQQLRPAPLGDRRQRREHQLLLRHQRQRHLGVHSPGGIKSRGVTDDAPRLRPGPSR